MKALVYGGGAVGLGIGSCLVKSGASVTFLARQETRLLLDSKGLAREGIFGDYHALPGSFRTIGSLDEVPSGEYDYILVCTKSFDTQHAASDIKNHVSMLGKKGKIVLFQNGWGNAEIMSGYLGKRVVYSGRVITGFVRTEPNRVKITVHADAIRIGSLFSDSSCEELLDLSQAITDGGIECVSVQGIGRDLWAKMLYNCALNPVGALFSVPYGVLAESEYSRELMNEIIAEIYSVMDKCGFSSHWKTPEEYNRKFYTDLVRLTAAHESSMLQDIRAGRKTEIDALNGEIVRLAYDAGISVPVNLTITRMIKFIESRNRKRD